MARVKVRVLRRIPRCPTPVGRVRIVSAEVARRWVEEGFAEYVVAPVIADVTERQLVIIPFGGYEPDRVNNLLFLVSYYSSKFNVHVERYDEEPWNKARCLNRAVAKAPADMFAIIDADTLIPHDGLMAAFQRHERGLTLPFNEMHYLDENGGVKAVCASRNKTLGRGGAWVTDRETWTLVGGMDERFRIWADEDTSFYLAVQTLVKPPVHLPHTGYHLHHSHSYGPWGSQQTHPHLTANRALCTRYQQATGKPDEMQALISERRPTLNVLTRTSNRPWSFGRCRRSLLSQQTGLNVRHFVSVDRPCRYAEGDVVVETRGDNQPVEAPEGSKGKAPYNLYINDLLDAVDDGWVFVLDDDNEFVSAGSLSRLEPYLTPENEDRLLCFQTEIAGLGVIPKRHEIKLNDFDSACFCYHIKHRQYWTDWSGADYLAAHALSQRIRPLWIDECLVRTQTVPRKGEMEKLSIIIPVYNQSHYTRQILAQIPEVTHVPYEVIVVDNGSTDDTSDILSELDVGVIRNEKNMGVYVAWNQGCREAQGSHIAIINNDLWLPDGWAETLLAHGEPVICPSYEHGEKVHLRSPVIKPLSCFEAERPGVHPRGFAGFCFMFAREVWERVGPFDEDFFYWFGDLDWWERARRYYHPMMSENVTIHHYKNQTVNICADFKLRIQRERALYRRKWGHDVGR